MAYNDGICILSFHSYILIKTSTHNFRTKNAKCKSDRLSKTCGFPFKTTSQVPSSPVVCPCRGDALGLSAAQRQRNTCCRIRQTPFSRAQEAFTSCADLNGASDSCFGQSDLYLYLSWISY